MTTLVNRVRVRRAGLPTPGADVRATHPKMTIRDERNNVVTLPYAPKAVEHGGLAPSYTEATRPGRAPLVLRASDPLPTMTFDVFVGAPNHQSSAETLLALLRRMAAQQDRLTVSLGQFEAQSGPWRVTGMTVTSLERQHGSNDITRATVSMTFTKAVDAAVAVGPVSGGTAPAPAVAPAPAAPAPKAPVATAPARYYVVKKGDTLWAIAHQFYRDGNRWRAIADRNGVRDPRKLQIGTRLVIP